MHESALLRDLRAKLEELGRPGERIRTVRLWVGALSPVGAAVVRDHWADVVRGTPAEGAALVVDTSVDLADPLARSVVLREVAVEGLGSATGSAVRESGSTGD